MENIKITFLGTGATLPTKKKNPPSILINIKDENILIDCAEGTQRQLRTMDLSPSKISKILITHWHGDHILGLPGLLQTLALSQYNRTLKIYGPRGTKRFMSLIQELIMGLKINIEVHEVSGIFIDDKDFQIEAREMNHGIPTNAYSIILKDKVRIDKAKLKKLKIPNSRLIKQLQQGKDIVVNGKKIKSSSIIYKEKGKKVSIVLDTGITENAIKLAKDSDILICESTFSKEEEAIAKHHSHLTSEQAAQIAKRSKSKKLILIHISQRYEAFPHIIEKEAKKIFKNTKLVNDFGVIEI